MCAISLEHKDDFCASPPFGFHVAENTGRMVCEDNSVIILVRDTKFEGRDVVIEVFRSSMSSFMTESSFPSRDHLDSQFIVRILKQSFS